jgi:uncharacterized cupredoxin-like copper-binding protein
MVGAAPRAALFAALGSALLLFAGACSVSGEPAGPTTTPASPTSGEITVVSFEWGFEPEAISLQVGQEITLTLENNGDILHNLNVDGLKVDVIEEISSGGFSGDNDKIFVGADSDDVGLLRFVPLEAGEYEFYCTIGNHRQLGMEGRLTVQ